MSETYTYKVALFENGKPEEFLLIIRELNNNLEVIGGKYASGKIQYLLTHI